jgi:hypothetical protein
MNLGSMTSSDDAERSIVKAPLHQNPNIRLRKLRGRSHSEDLLQRCNQFHCEEAGTVGGVGSQGPPDFAPANPLLSTGWDADPEVPHALTAFEVGMATPSAHGGAV